MLCRKEYRKRLGRITAGLLLSGWGMAWAAVDALQKNAPDLLGWPWIQIIIGVWISAWGGGAATLTRYLAAKYDGRTFHTRVEVIKDLTVSAVVGTATYLTGWFYAWPSAVVGLVLLLAGWLGVRLLSAAADQLLSAVRARRGI